MPGQREWKLALRLRYALEADERRAANRPATPPSAVAPRTLPIATLHAPQLRPDCEERRKVCRRAEDLLLD
jgi:hypothetical protein